MEEKICITVREMAQQIGVSMPTAYEMTHREGFPMIRVGRRVLVLRGELEKWLLEESRHGRAV